MTFPHLSLLRFGAQPVPAIMLRHKKEAPIMINDIGNRVNSALLALIDPSLRADLNANAATDAQQTQLLDTLGTSTTALREQVEALAAKVDAGAAIDPAEFAFVLAAVRSLDEAFPAPPAPEVEAPEVTG